MPRHYFRFGLLCAWLAVGLAGAAEFVDRPEIRTEPVVSATELAPLPADQIPAATGLTLPTLPTDVSPVSPEVTAETTPQAPEGPPTFQTPAIPKQWRAQPGGQGPNFEQSLEAIFDRRARNGVSLPGTSIIVGHPLTELGVQAALRRKDLHAKAAPWRTENQLKELKKTPRAQDEPFRFTVIGDAEPGRFAIWRFLFNVPGVFARLLKDSARHGADFTVQLGDMVSRGTVQNFWNFFRELAQVAPEKPYLTVIGNHDRRSPHGISNSRLYRSVFGPTDYFFDHGGVRFVTLDSSAGRVSAQQLDWLDKTLSTKLRTVVFTHMAPAVIQPWGKNGGDRPWGGFKDGSDEFTDIVSRHGVQRVYVGHIHGLRVKEYEGVRYVITGGGGSPLYPGGVHNNFHHYLSVEVTPDGIRETVHRADGTTFSLP
jgi:predicted phosphodiesterase